MNYNHHQICCSEGCKASYRLRYPSQQQSAHCKELRIRGINH